MNHGSIKSNFNCCAIDYCIHTLDTAMPLLANPIFYPDRDNIKDHSAKALPTMVIYLYRMLAHIYYHHRKLFDSLEYKYRIGERLTLYCKKFNIKSLILKNIILKYKILLCIMLFLFFKKNVE
jgi:hypothetical protein